MRFHLRRSLVYSLLFTCGFIFLLTSLRNGEQLDSLEPHYIENPHVQLPSTKQAVRVRDEPRVYDDVIPPTRHAEDLQPPRLQKIWEPGSDEENDAVRIHEKLRVHDDTILPNRHHQKPRPPHQPNLWEPGPDKWNDRILAQMDYVPDSYTVNGSDMKFIYVPGGLWDTPLGQVKFKEQQCPVDRCQLTTLSDMANKADAILFQNSIEDLPDRPNPRQIWILWLLESPYNTISLSWFRDRINWTATYRADSTIVTPYEKFVPFRNGSVVHHSRNYAAGKTEILVAWFVSNCAAINQRHLYVKRLEKYVGVDIFGACGDRQCPRGPPGGPCDRLLNKQYKFYLSFENSNCEYYVTEKLFWNALLNDVVPIVMGARKADYLMAAPPHSYIHVEDFSSVKSLAKYLLKLNRNDHMYNQYFQWKGTGSFINTKFWCRMCAMLHDDDMPEVGFDDVETWWRGNGTCTRDRWDVATDLVEDWTGNTNLDGAD